jgi:hypothetical protein
MSRRSIPSYPRRGRRIAEHVEEALARGRARVERAPKRVFHPSIFRSHLPLVAN